MAVSEELLRHAVDEILEPAWPHERRRAARRLSYQTFSRIMGGFLALWGLASPRICLSGLLPVDVLWADRLARLDRGLHDADRPDPSTSGLAPPRPDSLWAHHERRTKGSAISIRNCVFVGHGSRA